MNKNSAGFTLIELMITLVVAAVLMAVAVPGFNSIMKNNAVQTQTDLFVGTLNYARSEAARLNRTVTVCRSTSGSSCSDSSAWADGWIVYEDVDSDGVVEAGDGDTVLRVFDGIAGDFNLTPTSGFAKYVTYRPTGESNQSGNFLLCPVDGDNKYARKVIINNVGRPRIDSSITSGC